MKKILLAAVIFSLAMPVVRGQDGQVYKNKQYGLELKKLSGWEFQELEDLEPNFGAWMLNLSFSQKAKQFPGATNKCLIGITKLARKISDSDKAKSFEDHDTQFARTLKRLKNGKYIQEPRTITVNKVKIREAVFESGDSPKYVSRLMFFYPIDTTQQTMLIQVMFESTAKEYEALAPDFDAVLNSLKITDSGEKKTGK